MLSTECCLALAMALLPVLLMNLGRAKKILDFLFSSKNHLTLSHCSFPVKKKKELLVKMS